MKRITTLAVGVAYTLAALLLGYSLGVYIAACRLLPDRYALRHHEEYPYTRSEVGP